MAKTAKPLPTLEWLEPRLSISRIFSLLCFFGLGALLLVWNLWFANVPGKLLWVILGVQLAPLLLLAPGLILGNARAHAWACFVVNL